MAEDLTDYFKEIGIKVTYLHSDIDTIERMEIIRDLRLGKYDVLVGINLLREGLDLPEVSLVAILDADKEGFLRSETSLIQTVGRAARNVNGQVIMYADSITKSMENTIKETNRRREIQARYNKEHNITPRTVSKGIRDVIEATIALEEEEEYIAESFSQEELTAMIDNIREAMLKAAEELNFEKAAELRDKMIELKKMLDAGIR